MIKEKKEKLKNLLKEIQNPKEFRVFRQKKGYVESLGNDIYLRFPYNKKLVAKIKLMKCFAYDKEFGHRWRLKEFDYHKAKMILNLNKDFPDYYWIIDPLALEILQSKILEFEEKAKLFKNNVRIKKKLNNDIEISELKTELRPFQKVAVEFIEANNGIAFIADEMGLGKSIESFAYTLKNSLRTVIVCPKYLKYNWKDKIEKFSDKKALIFTKKKKNEEISDFDYIIVSYGECVTRKDQLKKIKYECVILDESHYIKTTSSARTKAVKTIFSKYKHRILLSGTPLINKPIEFYEQFRFLRPDIISKKENFGIRFCDATQNEFGNKKGYNYDGASNLKELYSLMQFFYIRRIKEEVLDDLPSKERNLIPFDLSSYTEYNKILKEAKTKEGKEVNGVTTANSILNFLSHKKMDFFDSFFKNLIEENPDKKIVVFSRFRSVQYDLFEKYKDIASKILGDDSDEEREKNRLEFENNPDKKICIVSTGAAKGFDLVSADTVFFFDLPWSPKIMEQAEDRSHRIGQRNQVNVYIPIINNTIELDLWEKLQNKNDILSEVTEENIDFIEIQKNIQSEVISSIF